MLELYVLLGFMLIAAVIAVELKDLLSSVVALGAAGLGLSVVFLLLKAPDLAITQLIVEILIIVVLIKATIKKDISANGWKAAVPMYLLTVGFLIMFLLIANMVIKELPEFGAPIMRVAGYYLDYGLKATGAANLVASIVLNFRNYDTIAEAVVLFTAIMGTLAILRKIGRKKIGQKVSPEDE